MKDWWGNHISMESFLVIKGWQEVPVLTVALQCRLQIHLTENLGQKSSYTLKVGRWICIRAREQIMSRWRLFRLHVDVLADPRIRIRRGLFIEAEVEMHWELSFFFFGSVLKFSLDIRQTIFLVLIIYFLDTTRYINFSISCWLD